MVSVEEIVKATKTSVSLENIAQCCSDLKQNIDKATIDRKENLSIVQKQRKNIQKEIKRMRVKIDSHLDELEKGIMTELDAAEEKIKSQIETVLTQLSAESKSVDELHCNVLAVKEYASDLQTFLGIKTMGAQVEKKEKFLRSLLEDGNLQELKLSCSIDKMMSDILSYITFGSISIDTSTSTIDMKTERDKQAQIMSVIKEPTLKSLRDITLTLNSTINIQKIGKLGNFIAGCTVLPDRKMVFADYYNGRLVIQTVDGKINMDICCCESLTGPYDVTRIDDRTVAVTTDSGIQIINIESKQTERTITTSGGCCGITYHKGTLLWCEKSMGIQMLQLTDQKVTTVVRQDRLASWAYITTHGDNIYQTDYNNHTVTCFTTKGEKSWEYKDESVMPSLVGVAVDNNYNVYTASRNTNSVVVLSPDGQQSRKLSVGHQSGLDQPTALHCDIKNNKLLVLSYSGSGFLYSVALN